MVITRAAERFQKLEVDTTLPSMSPKGLVHLKGTHIFLVYEFERVQGWSSRASSAGIINEYFQMFIASERCCEGLGVGGASEVLINLLLNAHLTETSDKHCNARSSF